MSRTRLGLTTKATPRKKKKNLRIFSGHKYPNVRVVCQPKMAPQALDLVTEGSGLQSADSAEAGFTKYWRIQRASGQGITAKGLRPFQGALSTFPAQLPQFSSWKPRYQCYRITWRVAGEDSSLVTGLQGQAVLWGRVIPEASLRWAVAQYLLLLPCSYKVNTAPTGPFSGWCKGHLTTRLPLMLIIEHILTALYDPFSY